MLLICVVSRSSFIRHAGTLLILLISLNEAVFCCIDFLYFTAFCYIDFFSFLLKSLLLPFCFGFILSFFFQFIEVGTQVTEIPSFYNNLSIQYYNFASQNCLSYMLCCGGSGSMPTHFHIVINIV